MEATIEGSGDYALNEDRALAFSAPVLISADPDAVLAGFSIGGVDDVDTLVESAHVGRQGGTVRAVSVRTELTGDDADWVLQRHALDYLQNTVAEWANPTGSSSRRSELVAALDSAPRRTTHVLIDGEFVPARVIEFGGTAFALVATPPDHVITIAGPPDIVASGFTTLRR